MTVELEDRLRTSLHREASRAPLESPEWVSRHSARAAAPRRPWLAVAASVVLVAGGAVAIAASRRTDTNPSVTTVPPTLVPSGEEFELEALSPDDIDLTDYLRDPVRPGSVAVAGWEGRVIVAYTTIDTFGGGLVDEYRCVYAFVQANSNGSFGTCQPIGDVPQTSTFGRWWGWFNVPAGTDFVQYRDGDSVYWQHPIGGFVVFPNVEGQNEQVLAVDADGAVIARADWATVLDMQQASPVPMGFDSLDSSENQQVWAAAVGGANLCLKYWQWDDQFANEHPASEVDEAWSTCLAQARTAAQALFDALGGHLVDEPSDDPGVVMMPDSISAPTTEP